MATDKTENKREQSNVLLSDLYSGCTKFVQSREREVERLETSRRTKQQGDIYKTDVVKEEFNV
jgi:hypothetical protein